MNVLSVANSSARRRLAASHAIALLAPARQFGTSSPALAKAAAKKAPASQGKKSARFKNSGSGEGKKRGALTPLSGKFDHPLFKDRPGPSNLPAFHPETFTPDSVGKAVGFPADKSSAINAFGVPKGIAKELVHLERPFSIIRGVSLETFDTLDKAATQSSANSRFVLTGKSGSGKSHVLLQAVNYCATNNWIVLYVPRAIEWMNSSSAYVYDTDTKTFLQPNIASDVLRQLATVNASSLQSLVIDSDVSFDKAGTITAGSNIDQLAHLGIKDASIAPKVLRILLEELGKQTKYPVLLAIDDVQALYCTSKYRDPQFNYIKGFNLSMPRLMLEYAGGMKSFARGAVLGALSTADTTFRIPLPLTEALQLTPDRPVSAYEKRSADLALYSKGLRPIPIPERLEVNEAASLFEVWNENKALHTVSTDQFFLSTYSQTSGNPRQFVLRGLLSTLAS
ncbi:hypothetical protein BOTBODRAFT_133998 [Botryobasidium botryosum FD-172 SS1]|uniref:Small ribosomal subunit protein mS29 n=1 Tax=Botryobasidium botryosum (strain FD-172 SS1) TaxID=930990 RepID=A0A067MEE3_BOTB1|nr:hypothetical protein BOTBODRAFT_133998 [Botryobasidium botryosum FD-172 SS1]